MPRTVIVSAVDVYKAGQVVELSAAEITDLGANARATAYRDQAGQGAAASNSN
jgi:hypothetical protein